ncbi:MAG: dephospho-CoA kinase [Sporomusaceae bacterium]|jgi:dephospho-CoA kinase|nr:dephospho-CoA kinase [Sporomusaceae bacterium]
MHIIGLTGGIASGKSTVSNILREEFGALVIDVDRIARQISLRGAGAYEDIVNRFGHDIIKSDGEIDRKRLGEIVFNDQGARKDLEAITHFRIGAEVDKLLQGARADGLKVAVVDAPLLLEAGWQGLADEIWLVYLDEETQINRLRQRDGLSLAEALSRIKSQMPLSEKKKYAQVIIDNSAGLEKTKEQVIFHYRATYSFLE